MSGRPEERGGRNGQVKQRVPQVVFAKTDDLGVSKVSINPFFDPKIDRTTFADVRTISLDFLDGELVSLWIGFENTFKWPTLDEFVKGISDQLAVPGNWQLKGRNQQLKCADFELNASMIGGGPSVRLIESAAEETIAARRQAKEDAATGEAATDSHSVIGDTRSRIYYAVDCDALKAVPEKSRLSFDNEVAAEKAGYKRADGCR